MKPDLTIRLVSDKSRSRWAYETFGAFTYISHFATGHLAEATSQTLLAFALTSALKTITPHNVYRYLLDRKEHINYAAAKKDARNLRVKVQTVNIGIHRTLNHIVPNVSKISENIQAELQKELKRFKVECSHCEPKETVKAMNWSRTVLPARTFECGFPMPEQLRTA